MKQFHIYWTDFNPTKGAEINKVRPCVIVSPDEMNEYLKTVIVLRLASSVMNLPTRLLVKNNCP